MISSNSLSVFDALANRHDDCRWHPRFGGFDAKVDNRLAAIASSGRGRVLALGGGSGPELRAFVASGWDCGLVDISPAMLQLAREHYPDGVQIMRCDAVSFLEEKLEQQWDVLLHVGELICYVDDPKHLCFASSAALRDGGKLVQTFVDAGRMMERLKPNSWWSTTYGIRFKERIEPELVITSFHEYAILQIHKLAGLLPTEILLGPGPRSLIISTKTTRG